MSRYLRDRLTHTRTHIQGSTYRSACGETKKRKRHVLTFPKTKLHAKNWKILSRGFPGKGGGDRQTDRQTERQTERDGPEFKGLPDTIAKPSDQKT